MEGLRIIVKMKFGSHLYGTATEKSDLDYKGIYLPTKEQILLNRFKKSHNIQTKKGNCAKNTSDDIDIEFYSLHYFIKLACEGQTVALDMLHAPSNMILEKDGWIWDDIVRNREKFYTKNLQAFIDYAKKQAAKYGIKGSRIQAAKEVINILKSIPDQDWKLETFWASLPLGEHRYMVESSPNGIRQYQVCGKILQETQKVGYTLSILEKFVDQYGKRAKLAEANEGIDWKAVSHAARAAYQVKELLTMGTITFPLVQAPYLLAVKNGELDYISEVSPKLEALIDEVGELSKNSTLPAEADKEFWDKFIIETIEAVYYDILS